MPQPIERNEIIAGLRVIERVSHSHYSAKCRKCKRSITVAARSLRIKRSIECRQCFPARKVPGLRVYYDNHRGWPEVQAA
jgi:hypothetical protein